MSDPENTAADKAARDANYLRTLAMPRQPSEEEQDKLVALAKDAKNHLDMAVHQWPMTRQLLAESQKYSAPGLRQDIEYAPLLTESLEALGPIVAKFGLAAFDGEVQAMSQELTIVAKHALLFYPGYVAVTLTAGILIKALLDRNIMQRGRNILEHESVVMRNCKNVLLLNVEDLAVQKLYRNLLLNFGYLRLDPIAKVQIRKALHTAQVLMTPSVGSGQERVPTTLQDVLPAGKKVVLEQELQEVLIFLTPSVATLEDVLQCLAKVVEKGQFVCMCDDEHVEFKTQVAVFAAWCLAGCIRESENASFFGNLVVGRQACVLLYQMAAGCMQENATHLFEEHRQILCDLDIPKLLLVLKLRLHADGGSPDDACIDWLFVRLERTPLQMDGSGPGPVGAPAAKRRRGEGGSA